jgi:hypothetical protein
MAEKNYDELDRALDAALAKYAAAEPRAGLEGRILATLRTASDPAPDRAWWRWTVMAAVAAVLLVTVALGWRTGKPRHPAVADHLSHASQAPLPETEVVSNAHKNGVQPHVPHHLQTTTHHDRLPVVATVPRLEQFPSPLPLSEQEEILASYVSRYPEHAVLVARARAEALLQEQKDQKEELRETDSDRDSQETNKQK